MKPITPDEVINNPTQIPSIVFEVINQLIVKNWDSKSKTAFVLQEDAQKELCNKMKITSDDIYQRKLLFIEAAYRKAGWYVEYKKADYYDADAKLVTGFLFGLEP